MSKIKITNLKTQQEITTPSTIGSTHNVTWENGRDLVLAAGGRIDPGEPVLQDGYARVSKRFVDEDGVNGMWEVNDRAIAEIEAEQAAADLQANGPRYILENQYIILCDVLRVALGGQGDRTKLGFEELPGMMLALKAGNAAAYEKLRDAMDMLNMALIRYDVRWWDNAVWHPQPELAEASNAIMGVV